MGQFLIKNNFNCETILMTLLVEIEKCRVIIIRYHHNFFLIFLA
jgi:hypothetical protein